MFQITIHSGTNDLTLQYQKPTLLASILQEAGMDFSMPCGGKGTCGKCRVTARGALSEPGEQEKRILGEALQAGVRLACMTTALGDTELFLTSRDSVVLSEGELPDFVLEPEGKGLGMAVDVGTTTVAVYLYDLGTGRLLGEDSFPNPQSLYGADVISRIQKALEGEAEALRSCLLIRLRESFLRLCAGQNQDSGMVENVVVTGNTTMLYLLFGESTEPLSHAPFEVREFYGRTLEPSALGIPEFGRARVTVPPLVSAFVGSDIMSAVLSSGMTRRRGLSLLIDVGTNGEMALWDGEKLFCCSTAAGPAFEGAGISMGMNAAPGAVSGVRLREGRLEYTVIGGGEAAGICGSGLIDAMAALLEAGLVDETGCVDEENEPYSLLLTEQDGEPAVRIGDSGILLTQKDIREIQLAKAAICAGVRSLAHEAGRKVDEVEELLLAGGFGSFINCESAGRIGLIPPELAQKARAVGNAAGMGAVLELLSLPCREESRGIAARAELLELSSSPYFMEQYVDSMLF